MKIVSILFLSLFFTCGIRAQELSEGLKKIKDICLLVRQGVTQKDKYTIMESIDELHSLRWTEFIRFKTIEPSEESSLKGHLQFTPAFLDSLLLYQFDFNLVPSDLHAMRRPGSMDFHYIHKALAPRATGIYQIKGGGEMELLVVAEQKGLIQVSIEDNVNNLRLHDGSDTGKEACELVWKMEKPAEFQIKIENKTDMPISFIIVSN